ncbi:exodeoxyribonuclease VII large subunit [Peptoniphilus catoniae]|uniref:exodeoxyribonuclease VII large subunit n=1 Tax=Peptoniphilus catoniae TaxID=1660341 RepID=UPI0010FF0D5A|nr:exodeoxyribonuclease VII large subunit [Peptoniphilus catoniae]
MAAIKVSELNRYIKKYIAMDYLLSDILVLGEISNINRHSNGNIYLSLKDDKAKINGIIYSNDARNLKMDLKNGDNVEARGSVSIYERDGALNIYIREVNVLGIGNLYEKFIYLRDRLNEEGLFSKDHKKNTPYFPRRVGVITSPTGAAIRDFINVLKRRNPTVDIILYPANVQGDKSVDDLIKALDYLENKVDVIVLTRGGGSLEELFSFNDEDLARKVYSIDTPVISAVGHEIDFVITDFVSDLRAPTPSAAAELVSMSREDLNNSLFLLKNSMDNKIINKLNESSSDLNDKAKYLKLDLKNFLSSNRKNIDYLNRILRYKKPDIKRKEVLLYNLSKSLNQSFKNKLTSEKNILKALELRLKSPELLIRKENLKIEILNDKLKSKNLSIVVDKKREYLNLLRNKLVFVILERLRKSGENLANLKANIEFFNPSKEVSIRDKNGRLLISASRLSLKDKISIDFSDGSVDALVENIKLRGGAHE